MQIDPKEMKPVKAQHLLPGTRFYVKIGPGEFSMCTIDPWEISQWKTYWYINVVEKKITNRLQMFRDWLKEMSEGKRLYVRK